MLFWDTEDGRRKRDRWEGDPFRSTIQPVGSPLRVYCTLTPEVSCRTILSPEYSSLVLGETELGTLVTSRLPVELPSVHSP